MSGPMSKPSERPSLAGVVGFEIVGDDLVAHEGATLDAMCARCAAPWPRVTSHTFRGAGNAVTVRLGLCEKCLSRARIAATNMKLVTIGVLVATALLLAVAVIRHLPLVAAAGGIALYAVFYARTFVLLRRERLRVTRVGATTVTLAGVQPSAREALRSR